MTPRVDRRTLFVVALGAVATACATGSGVDTVGRRPADGAVSPVPDEASPVAPLAPPVTLAMIGDSLTVQATPLLEAALPSTGLEVSLIDAQVGRRMTQRSLANGTASGADVIRFVQGADPPDLWVVALGANDIGQYADAEGYAEQVEAVLAAIPASVPLVWVNAYYADFLDDSVLFDSVLREQLDRRGRAVVADWFSAADDDGVLTGDGVHPTTAGAEVFTGVVVDAVDELLASL